MHYCFSLTIFNRASNNIDLHILNHIAYNSPLIPVADIYKCNENHLRCIDYHPITNTYKDKFVGEPWKYDLGWLVICQNKGMKKFDICREREREVVV